MISQDQQHRVRTPKPLRQRAEPWICNAESRRIRNDSGSHGGGGNQLGPRTHKHARYSRIIAQSVVAMTSRRLLGCPIPTLEDKILGRWLDSRAMDGPVVIGWIIYRADDTERKEIMRSTGITSLQPLWLATSWLRPPQLFALRGQATAQASRIRFVALPKRSIDSPLDNLPLSSPSHQIVAKSMAAPLGSIPWVTKR